MRKQAGPLFFVHHLGCRFLFPAPTSKHWLIPKRVNQVIGIHSKKDANYLFVNKLFVRLLGSNLVYALK